MDLTLRSDGTQPPSRTSVKRRYQRRVSMSSTVASNPCAEIIHHASDGILEQRWLPGQTTEGSFKASLALLALEAERLPPSAIHDRRNAISASSRARGSWNGATTA